MGHTLGCALPRQVSPGLLAGNEAQGDQIAGVVGLPRWSLTVNSVCPPPLLAFYLSDRQRRLADGLSDIEASQL